MQTALIPSLPLTMSVARWSPGWSALINALLSANLLRQRPPSHEDVKVTELVKALNEITLLTV